ncbi:MAG TPA: LamG-like jellyroll fold domain-containing protein [Flavobacteriales bacterium]|jgi:hypothetical protein|nr:LamG-like jellyroll fold domain-containing protein [Flavobacteriales bacterium]
MRFTTLCSALLVVGFPVLVQAQKCMLFDGVDDHVQLPNISLNAIGTGDFTVEAIVRGDEAAAQWHPRLFSNRDVTNNGFMFFFHGLWGGSQYKMLCVQLSGQNYLLIDNGTYNGSLLDGTCHHVAISREVDTLFFYADGVLFGQRVVLPGATAQSPAPLALIGNDAPDPYPFNGNISELRLWNVARTAAEIQAHMMTTVAANSTGLVGYWPMNEGAGQFVEDHTGIANGHLGGDPEAVDPEDPQRQNNCCAVLITAVEPVSEEAVFQLYPNPASTQLTIELGSPGVADLSLVDALGRIVRTQRLNGTAHATCDIAGLSNGVYLAVVRMGDQVRTVRVVKEQ